MDVVPPPPPPPPQKKQQKTKTVSGTNTEKMPYFYHKEHEQKHSFDIFKDGKNDMNWKTSTLILLVEP